MNAIPVGSRVYYKSDHVLLVGRVLRRRGPHAVEVEYWTTKPAQDWRTSRVSEIKVRRVQTWPLSRITTNHPEEVAEGNNNGHANSKR